MNAFTKRKKKKKYQLATMARILGNTFFMEARLSTRKKDSSQLSIIARYACKFGKYVAEKKNKRKANVEPPGKKASNEVKAGEASFKIYRLLQV